MHMQQFVWRARRQSAIDDSPCSIISFYELPKKSTPRFYLLHLSLSNTFFSCFSAEFFISRRRDKNFASEEADKNIIYLYSRSNDGLFMVPTFHPLISFLHPSRIFFMQWICVCLWLDCFHSLQPSTLRRTKLSCSNFTMKTTWKRAVAADNDDEESGKHQRVKISWFAFQLAKDLKSIQ